MTVPHSCAVAFFAGCLLTIPGLTSTARAQAPAVKDLAPTKWIVLGSFPNEPLTTPGGSGATRSGFEKDFLAPLGGEEKVKISGEANLSGTGAKVTTLQRLPNGLVDFAALYQPAGNTDNRVAYAYGILRSDRDQTLHLVFGSDDAARVWVNGKLVHSMWTPGRGAEPESDRFTISVRKGDNPILVKVENAVGGWGFYLSAYDQASHKEMRMARARRDLANHEIVRSDGRSGNLIGSPNFPRLEWKNSLLMEPLVGDEPLTVRWFDADANEVTSATKPGLYAAHIEAKLPGGRSHRRLMSFTRVDSAWSDWLDGLIYEPTFKMSLPDLPHQAPFTADNWRGHRPVMERYVSATFGQALAERPVGAQLTAYLMHGPDSRLDGLPSPAGVYATDHLLKVRRKLLNRTGSPLKGPRKRETPAPTLRLGTAVEAGMKPDVVEKARALCTEWAREEGKPFSLVLARNGVVFLHDAFGELNGKKLDKDASFYPASIGKTFAGIVFARFVDQGLISPEDPLGRFLPDFPTSGSSAITFRQCFTHTSGIAGHGTYGGPANAYLDNAFSGWLPSIRPGTVYQYGGDGNNLAGLAMELLTGTPMPLLLRENLFAPLGTDISQHDLGWANQATAMEVARVGQLLVNKGSYGDWELFTPETYAKILPRKLSPLLPDLQDKTLEWGLGLSWMTDPDGPRDKSALGPNVIGHGSASSSLFRVDLDSGLILVSGRYGIGDAQKHGEYRARLMSLLKESLVSR